jgi:hypothetical protein
MFIMFQKVSVPTPAPASDVIAEDGLSDLLGEVPVAAHLPERGGIDQVDVSPNEFREGVLATASSKPRQ